MLAAGAGQLLGSGAMQSARAEAVPSTKTEDEREHRELLSDRALRLRRNGYLMALQQPLTEQDLADLAEIGRLMAEANEHAIAAGDPWHTGEGAVSVSFSTFCAGQPAKVSIYTTLLGQTGVRIHEFDSIRQALDTVRVWHRNEMIPLDEDETYSRRPERDPYFAIDKERRRRRD